MKKYTIEQSPWVWIIQQCLWISMEWQGRSLCKHYQYFQLHHLQWKIATNSLTSVLIIERRNKNCKIGWLWETKKLPYRSQYWINPQDFFNNNFWMHHDTELVIFSSQEKSTSHFYEKVI